MKNSSDTRWDRTSDLPICSTASYPLCHRGHRKLVPARNMRDNVGITPLYARINVATNHIMYEVTSSSNFLILILAYSVPTIHTQFTGSAHLNVLEFQKVESSP
jgi:hypothetical protein